MKYTNVQYDDDNDDYFHLLMCCVEIMNLSECLKENSTNDTQNYCI